MNPKNSAESSQNTEILSESDTETIPAKTAPERLAATIHSQLHVPLERTTEHQQVFDRLRTTVAKPEGCKDCPTMSDIEEILLKNPRMMLNIKKLQDAGAELVVTALKEGQYIEFADAAQALDIKHQEARLAELSEQEIAHAIETILEALEDDADKVLARAWFSSELQRPKGAKGLNYAEALVYAVAHGGTLISYKLYSEMAGRGPKEAFDSSKHWYWAHVSKAIDSNTPMYSGYRAFRMAGSDPIPASTRSQFVGARVRISVEIGA